MCPFGDERLSFGRVVGIFVIQDVNASWFRQALRGENLLTVVYDVADIGVYRPWVRSPPTASPEEENPMRSFSAAIALGAMAFLTCGLRAEESTTGSHSTPASLLPGISADDPRIRVDPDVMPWRAVGKLQAASMNFRASCTARRQ